MARLVYRFGDCSVDLAARELRRGGAAVTLSPKVFDVLAYLIEHRDRAVGRDELIAAVWGRADVSDALLGQVVLKVRRAVGDTGEEQHAIRTVPRFGYHWVADIDVEERAAPAKSIEPPSTQTDAIEPIVPSAGTDEPAIATTSVTPRSPRRFALLAVLAALLVLAAFVLLRRATAPATETAIRTDAIAVLPVAVDAAPEWAWLRLGLMDLVASRLRDAGMDVVPNETIVSLARSADAATLAREVRGATGAHGLLAAQASRNEAGWRVHLEFDADGAAPIAVEARQPEAAAAARAAVAQLLMRLGKPVAADAAVASTFDDVRQRAEAAFLSDDLAAARTTIETAPAEVRAEPELRLRIAQIDLRNGDAAAARGELDRLVATVDAERDPILRARVLTVSSSVHIHEGQSDAADRDCRAALALLADRRDAGVIGRAHTACGIAAAVAGRFDEAMDDFSRARVAFATTGDALSLARIESNEGHMESTRGRHADGLAIMRRSEERFRRLGGRIEMLGAIDDQVDALLALLQPVEALATSERGWALLPQTDNANVRGSLEVQHARALAANGRLGDAAAVLVRVVDDNASGIEATLLGEARAQQALIELATGRAQAAAAHAREAVDALAGPDRARERALAWLTRVRALHALAQDDAANAESQHLLDWAAHMPVSAAAVLADLAAAELRWTTHRDDATASYERALAQAERGGTPADIAAVAVSWGHALLDAGGTERAAAVAGRVQRWADADFECSVLQARLYRALGQDEAWRTALQRTRQLAGERMIPPTVSAPRTALIGSPASAAR